MLSNECFRAFILFPCVCNVCACTCLQTCAIHVHSVCRCAAHMGVRSGGRAGSGSRAGGLGPEVGRQVQVGAPRGFSALMASMTHIPTWMQHGAHTRSLGGVSPPFPLPCEEAGPARAPPITNDRDGRTRSSRPTLQECASGASGAAPPAGSLGRRSRATSGLSLQITALRSTRFLALPWALASMWP